MVSKSLAMLLMMLCTLTALPARAEAELPAIVDIKRMSMDTALRMAAAAVARCWKGCRWG